MKPPVAKRIANLRTLHGQSWSDHYHWLRAENWQDCVDEPGQLPADIAEYLEQENRWFEHAMVDTQPLQAQLLAEMRGRIQDVDQALPDDDGPWTYLERYEAGDEHPRYCRYARGQNMEHESMQLLIDFNHEARNFDYYDPGDVEYSPAHTHLAWSADNSGAERYRACIRHLATGVDEDTIDDVYDLSWADTQYLFYTRVDENHRPSQVLRHKLGTPGEDDVLVYEELDPRFTCTLWTSQSGEYVFISADMDGQSEVWFIPVQDIVAKPTLIQARTEGLEYTVEHQGKRFLIHTNADDCPDFKIMSVACDSPERANWQDWLGYRPDIMVVEFYVYRHWVMWMERENALPRICYCADGEIAVDIQSLAFEQEAYALGLEPLQEFDNEIFRFSYQSPSQPQQMYSFDMRAAKRTWLKEDILPSGHCADDYVVRRLYATACDDEQVPMTVLYHKQTVPDGSAPCLLTAYGAYGSSIPAVFSGDVLSLLNRGFVYVIAHVRGGQEKGRRWYDAARGKHKQNTFNDVVSVANHLIAQGYTYKKGIVLSGGSAGGLMVGAVINQHPELWAGDDTLPLTPGEWDQWGNPLDSEAAFNVIRAYSPYENIQPQAYPPMLVTAGVSDPRVTYWEPAKWVARHRHIRHDDQLLVFKTNMSSGHFGETGRYGMLQDEAIEQAFALKVVGLGSSL